MTTIDAFRKLLIYKKACRTLQREVDLFRLTNLTPDLRFTATSITEHTDYVLNRLFRSRNLLRVLLGKPAPDFTTSLLDSGKKYGELSNDLGMAWHYQDNQMNRRKNAKKFLQKERVYAEVRDSLNGLTIIGDFGATLSKYFGAHKHIISERASTWVGYLVTFTLGIISAVAVGLIQDHIKKASQPTTKSYYYIPQLSESKDTKLPSAHCGNSNVTLRDDGRRCISDSLIYDPCFIDLGLSDIVMCPGDPREANKPEAYKVVGEAFGKVNHDSSLQEKKYEPWFIITESGSTCRYISGTSLVAADQRFNYGCNGGTESYLLSTKKKDGSPMTTSCVKNNDKNKIQECLIKEAWY